MADIYKSIIDKSPIGYACHKIILDDDGEPLDYEYAEVNLEFERIIDQTGDRLIGKRRSQVPSEISDEDHRMLALYAEIAIGGGSRTMEVNYPSMGKYYRIKLFSPQKYYFVKYMIDISNEKLRMLEIEELRNNQAQETELFKGDEHYRLIFENAVDAIIVVQDGRIKLCNAMAEQLTGFDKHDIMSSVFTKFIHPEFVESIVRKHSRRMDGEQFENIYCFKIVRKDTSVRWVEINSIMIEWDGRPAVLSFFNDVTERILAEEKLKVSEEKYRLLTEYASDVIWVLNLSKECFTYISPSVFHLRGFTVEEALKQTLEEALTPESRAIVKDAINTYLDAFLQNPQEPRYHIHELQQPCKDGRIIWIEISTRFRFNADGEIEIVGVTRNIEERKKAEAQVLYLSYYDQLTGLYNRRYYEEELKRLDIARNLPITLVMADVNGLKLTNDAFGHNVGDKLLKTIGDILKHESRAEDVVARIGGDEFLILLPRTSELDAELVVNRIKHVIAGADLEEVVLSVSFGLATKSSIHQDMDNVFNQAEDIMYNKKLKESNVMKSETVRRISKNLHQHDHSHGERVGELCMRTGQVMGLGEEEIREIGLLGLIHDIGIIGINESLLKKQGKLDEEEWREVKRHPEVGYQILRAANEYTHLAEFVLSHHERMDGTGYPRHLVSGEITLQSKILSVVEAFDAMTHNDIYRTPLSEEAAILELATNAGTQFDEKVARTFVEQVLGRNWA